MLDCCKQLRLFLIGAVTICRARAESSEMNLFRAACFSVELYASDP